MSYGTVTTITLTGASLASTSSRQGTAVGPLGGSPVDVQVTVKVTSGSTGTSATGVVNVYVSGSMDGTNFDDGAAGPDGAFTPTVPPNSVLLGQINVVANTVTYTRTFSIAKVYGSIPNYFNIILTNLSGHALAATATLTQYVVLS